MSISQDQTDQLAQSLPGFDAAPAIANLEQDLLSRLGSPTPQTLGELPLQQLPGHTDGPPADLVDLANQLDPFSLITPVFDGLGTLGSGQFSGMDPTSVFDRISSAVDGTSGPVQQAGGSAANDWQGESGTVARAKTRAAVASGSDVATQADGLRGNLSTAASNVAEVRQQMLDIVDEYQAKVAAADLSTPAGRSAALAAANQATADSTKIMQELQDNLGAHANQVSATGAPIGVTNSPAAGNTLLSDPMNWLMGSDGLPGAFNAVVNDPRVTPKGIAENFMNLFFLPTTVTNLDNHMVMLDNHMVRLDNHMVGLDSHMVETNAIMTNLGSTLETTNAALAPLPGALGNATDAMNGATGAMYDTGGKIDDMGNDVDGLRGDLKHADKNIKHTGDEVGQLNDDVDSAKRAAKGARDAIPHPALPSIPNPFSNPDPFANPSESGQRHQIF